MIKYFYLVTFEYLVNKDYTSHFDLGVFSTKKSAEEKIRKSVSLTGLNRYGIENFKIIKFGVDFNTDVKDKSNVILYCVTHEYDNECDGFTYWNIFDYFSTIETTNKHVEYLKKHSRIGKKYPDNFEIVEIKVDNFNSWSEGFDEIK